MSGGFFSIGYSVLDACWLVSEHETATDAARKGESRRSMGKGRWQGCAWNNAPWTEEQVRKAVDHLHASLVSNLTDAPAQIRRLGDAGYVTLPQAVEVSR